MGINTRRVKSLNNSCEMCDVSVVKLYEQNDERLVPNFRIISADNPKLIPFFSLTRSVSFSWFDYNLSFAHVPSDWVKSDKSQIFNKRSFL